MTASRPSTAGPLLLLLLTFGCRFPLGEGPVPKSLVTSRQFSQRAVAAIERGHWEEGEKVLAEAVRVCPTDPDARRHYAEALWHRGQGQMAVSQLEEASRLATEDAALHVRIAEMRLAMGQVDLARGSADQALDLAPKLSAASAIRGRVNRASGRLHEALADYHRALGSAPGDRAILLEIAELYRELDRPQRALATLHNLADRYSPGEEPQEVLYLQGLALSALGRYDDAVESLSPAVTRYQPTPEMLYRLAEAELHRGRTSEAAARATQALALDPGHEPSRNLLGSAELARGLNDSVQR